MGGRTEALFDAVPEAIVLVEFVDGEPIVRACNDTFVDLFGYTSDALAGESLNDYIVPEAPAREETAADIDAAAAAGRTIEREVTRCTADGTRDFLFRAAPFEEGDTVKSVGIYVDITDQRRERERYEALLEYSSDIITILDTSGRVRYESRSIQRVLGYEPETLLGEVAFDYIHPEDRERVVAEFERGLTDPTVQPVVEYRFRAADGSWRWLESIGSNHIDQPPVEGYVVNSRDITDRKEREQQLRWYRTYVHYQQKQRRRSDARVEANVLETERPADELDDDPRYVQVIERLEELNAEIEALEAELEELETEYDEVPQHDELAL